MSADLSNVLMTDAVTVAYAPALPQVNGNFLKARLASF
jgi:hypothetical protein